MDKASSEMGTTAMKLFIIHGWSYNLDKWRAIQPFLKAAGFEPVMLKVPGLTEPSEKVWDIEGYVEWLKNELKDEKQPAVIGHSNGGRISLAFAQKYPGRLKHLILIDSAGLKHPQLLRKLKLKILQIVAKILKPLKVIPGFGKLVYKLIGARDYFDAADNMRLTMRNMLAADNQINLHTIQAPTTIIWGDQDKITPLKDGRSMHRQLTESQLHIIAGARHAPQASHPEHVANLIAEAVKGV